MKIIVSHTEAIAACKEYLIKHNGLKGEFDVEIEGQAKEVTVKVPAPQPHRDDPSLNRDEKGEELDPPGMSDEARNLILGLQK